MKLSRNERVVGRLKLPGDKSISHRSALIAALASGSSIITNFSTALDCGSTLSCLQQLGVQIKRTDNIVLITGVEKFSQPVSALDCGNSGSTMRILAGVLARQTFSSELTGDSSLNSRPMGRIIEPLELMGAQIRSDAGKPPLSIQGAKEIRPIVYKLPVASAQVKSAVLFAGLGAHGRTQVKESSVSRDHTERLFNGFGVTVTTDADLTVTLDGPARLANGDITIPGDISSAAYFVAAAMMLPGSELTIEDVGLNPTRSEFLSVLNSWGADISTTDLRYERNEPVGTITVRGGIAPHLKDANARRLDKSRIPSLIDELPLLAVVGSQIPGGIEIRDASELRHKESDRLQATAVNLRNMGVEVEEHPDGLSISGPTTLRGTSLDSFGRSPYRNVVLCCCLKCRRNYRDPRGRVCGYFVPRVLQIAAFGRRHMTFTRPIVITGFMGCGKTEVARSLAKRLNLQMTDLDELIAQIEGRTAAQLIREEGEHSFRAIETKTLRNLLDRKTAGVIALGGGAWIEVANRALLERADALSVWLDTPFEVCWKRIAASTEDRPLGRTEDQTRELYLKRLPVYELARIRVQTSGEDDPDKLASLITST